MVQVGDLSMFGHGGHIFDASCQAAQPSEASEPDAVSTLCETAPLSSRLCEFAAELVQPTGSCVGDLSFLTSLRDQCFLGCTDVTAFNYNPAAISDDGSCAFDACASNPCLYGGLCTEETSGAFHCRCVYGHLGDRCETRITRYAYSPHCSITGPGIYGGRVDTRTAFTIHVVDQFGEPFADGDDDFIVELTALTDGARIHTSISHDLLVDHIFIVEYSLPSTAEYALSVTTVWGEHVTGSPTTVAGVVTTSSAFIPFSRAYGMGLSHAVAGTAAEFDIEITDRYGQFTEASASLLSISMSGGGHTIGTSPSFEGLGQFLITYTPVYAETYTVSINWGGVPLPSSPFSLRVASAPPIAAASQIIGDLTAKADTSSSFMVVSRDVYGNINADGSSHYTAWLSGIGQTSVSMTEMQNGTYHGTYIPQVAGQHMLHVYLGASEIQASPFRVTVTGPDPASSRCIASVPTTGTAGALVDVQIEARDRRGFPAQESLQEFSILVAGPEVQQQSAAAANTTFFNLTAAGIYSFVITLDSEPIAGSPHVVTIGPGAPILESTVVESHSQLFSVDDTLTIIMTTRDAHGNFVTGGHADSMYDSIDAPISITIGGPDVSMTAGHCWIETNMELPHACTADGHATHDGSYSLHLRIRTIGYFQVALSSNEQHFNATNFTVVVGDPDFSASALARPSEVVAGSTAVISLVLRDRYSNIIPGNFSTFLNGNATANSTSNVTANSTNITNSTCMDGNCSNVTMGFVLNASTRSVDHERDAYFFVNTSVMQNASGAYTVQCSPVRSGLYSMAITLGGHAFGAWMFHVIAANASAAASDVTGSGVRAGAFESVHRVVITLRDAYGNRNASTSENITLSLAKAGVAVAFVNASELGCMDPLAINFDDQAITPDAHTCIYTNRSRFSCPISGYLNENNMDLNISGLPYYANADAETCVNFCLNTPGCRSIDHSAARGRCYLGSGVAGIDGVILGSATYMYYQLVSTNDYVCRYGCTDQTATNYDSLAEADSGGCQPGMPGCTDPTALNVNATADVDDGSCAFTQLAWFTCPIDGALGGNNIQISGAMYIAAATAEACAIACYSNTACESIDYSAAAQRCYLNRGVAGINGPIISTAGSRYFEKTTNNSIVCRYGCTEPNAFNYQSSAQVDDGSCVSPPTVSLTPLSNGQFEALYRVEEASNYSVVVKLGLMPIRHGLIVEQVRAVGGVSAQDCVIASSSEAPAFDQAGVWSTFMIEPRDQFGVLLTDITGVPEFDIIVTGKIMHPCQDVVAFPGSTLTCDNVVDGSYCSNNLATWTQNSAHNDMTLADFCPETCNRCYGILQPGQIYDVNASFNASSGATVFEVNYRFNTTGAFEFQIYLGDSMVGTLTKEIIAGDLEPSAMTIDRYTGTVGNDSALFLQSRDEFGNNVRLPLYSEADVMIAMRAHPAGIFDTPMALSTSETDDGMFVSSYTVTKSGIYLLQVMVQSAPTWATSVPIHVDPGAMDSLFADTLTVEAGSFEQIHVYARDVYGNYVAVKPVDVNSIVLVSGPGEIQRPETGVNRTVSLNATVAGQYHLNVSVASMPNASVNASMVVTPGPPDPLMSEIVDFEGLNHSARVGVPLLVQLLTRDQYRNPVTAGGLVIDAFLTSPYLHAFSMDNSNGTYSLAISGRVAGMYAFTVRFNQQHVYGSPFSLKLDAGSVHPPSCAVMGSNDAVAGEVTVIRVHLQDLFENTIDRIDHRVVYTLMSDAGTISTGPLQYANLTRLWEAVFSASAVGAHEFQVYENGAAIFSHAFPIDVHPGVHSLNHSQISIPPEKHITISAGNPTAVELISRDRFGNRLTVGGLDVSVTAVDGMHYSVTDKESGLYRIALTFTAAHATHITVAVSGIALYPLDVTVVPGELSPSNCMVLDASIEDMPALVAGEVHLTEVQARDAFNNTIVEQTAAVFDMRFVSEQLYPQIELSAPTPTSVGGGRFYFSYHLQTSGRYDAAVTLLDSKGTPQHIQGSPMKAVVRADDITSPDNCTVSGSGLIGGLIRTNTSFMVVPRDAFGNRQNSSRHSLDVTIQSAETGQSDAVAFVHVNSTEEGEFLVTYMVTDAATYTISVLADNTHIAGSPFAVVIGATFQAVDASKCTVPVPAPTIAGDLGMFTVETRDIFGIPVSPETRLYNESLCASTILTHARPECLLSGNRSNVTDTVQLYLTELLALFECTVGDGLSLQNFSMLYELTDACGTEYTAQAATFNISASVHHNGSSVDLPVAYVGGGVFVVAYLLETSGIGSATIRVHAQSSGAVEIGSSPVALEVHPSVPSANHSSIFVRDNTTTMQAGDTHNLVVMVRDRFLNSVADSMYRPEAVVIANGFGIPEENVRVHGVGDGSYIVTFEHTVSGVYFVSITVAGAQVSNSPLEMHIEPGPISPLYTTLTGQGLVRATAGEIAHFQIHSRDHFGNNVTIGGSAAIFYARLTSAAGALHLYQGAAPEITDGLNGTYNVSYVVTGAGQYRMDIFLDGAVFADHEVECVASNISTSELTFTSDTQRPIVGSPTYFSIGLFDAFGNSVPGVAYVDRLGVATSPAAAYFRGAMKNATIDGNDIVIERALTDAGTYVVSPLLDSIVVPRLDLELTWVPASAPVAVEAALLADGSGLRMTFDTATDRGGLTGTFDCHLVFDEATVALFGESQCNWQDDMTMTVVFGHDNVIFAYAALLVDSSIARKEMDSLSSTGRLRILPPAEPLPLDLVTAYPSVLGLCSDMVIDCSSSKNSAPGPGSYGYSVDSAEPVRHCLCLVCPTVFV